MGKNKKAYLIGICGAGMSALAVLLKEYGWQVSGSDENSYEPIAGYLKRSKIKFSIKYAKKNVPKDADLVVIGNHVKLTKENNPEVKEAYRLYGSPASERHPIKSLPEALSMISKNKKNMLITGSYGKSTCTALVSWCLIKSKKDPSYFIGAIPINLEQSSHLGSGKDFVLEGDEYPSAHWDRTSKFLHFNPSSVLLISATHDHVNMFPTEKSYKEPYKKLVAKIKEDGLLVFNNEEKNTQEIVKHAKCRKIGYSLSKKNGWYAKNIKYGKITSFDLMRYTKKVTTIKTKLLGNHNIENIIGSGALLLENKKIKAQDFAKAVASFQGIKRRIELKTKKSSIPVYDGFGSSYDKAKVIFDALKLHFPKKRIVAIFEPHTFSWRNKRALKWYKTIFNDLGEVIILPPPGHGKNTHNQLTYNEIYNEVKQHTKAHKARTEKEALGVLKKIIKKNDIVALVSSGSMLGLSKSVPKLVEGLK